MEEASTAVGAVMAALAIFFVGLRFYARHYMKASYEWDDWLVLMALIFMLATDILVICALSADPDGPEKASDEDAIYTPEDVLYTQLSFVATGLYFTIAAATKLSILLLYNRLFFASSSFHRQFLVLFILVISYWIGCTVADFLNCIPIKYTWINSLADPRYCFNYNIYWFATGLCEAFLDLLIIAMPIGVVLEMRLSIRQKLAVGSVFILGAFAILSGLLKTIFGYVPGSRQPSFERVSLWATVHCGTGIICACLPVCWPLFVRLGKFRLRTWLSNSISSIDSPSQAGDQSQQGNIFNNFTAPGWKQTFRNL
ncbi:hypothetical protein GQ53DRAFT_783398 [Thozetella sp. PMI_491]|nr:hypothetical protein GQ53DRAFT_783398 [Thozetella sp. PMI_491]